MSKVTIDLQTNQIEYLVEHLSLADKIRIARRLNRETWQARFKSLLSGIDSRIKHRQVISNEKIVKIVKRVRKRNYAQSCN